MINATEMMNQFKALDERILKLSERNKELEGVLQEVNDYIESAHGINTIAIGSRLHIDIKTSLPPADKEEVCYCKKPEESAFIVNNKRGCANCGKKIREV